MKGMCSSLGAALEPDGVPTHTRVPQPPAFTQHNGASTTIALKGRWRLLHGLGLSWLGWGVLRFASNFRMHHAPVVWVGQALPGRPPRAPHARHLLVPDIPQRCQHQHHHYQRHTCARGTRLRLELPRHGGPAFSRPRFRLRRTPSSRATAARSHATSCQAPLLSRTPAVCSHGPALASVRCIFAGQQKLHTRTPRQHFSTDPR